MDTVIVVTAVCSTLAAGFSGLGVVLSLRNQRIGRAAADKMEGRVSAWKPPSLPQ